MALILTDEQKLLRETAREFVQSKSSLKRIRALRDTHDPLGFSRDLWREMAGLGWAGIVLPEKYGGAGLGYGELMVVMEELGGGLMPEPMLSTVLLGASAILLGGSEPQKKELLPRVASGDLVLSLAYQERTSRHERRHVTTRAERRGGGHRLSGEKVLVLDGTAAERLIVSARTAGETDDRDGITLFLVDAKASGVKILPQLLVDSRRAALVRLEGVEVEGGAVVGEVDRGLPLLEAVIDRATAGLTAEMLGSMLAAFQMTLDYLKTRKQFGVLIGTFQALKHRIARVFVETELSRSAVIAAHRSLDDGAKNVAEAVSIAKARLSDAFLLAGNEAVQLHGGIGMTDEHDIGFYLKRARAAEMTFGDAAWHRRRYADLAGY